MPFADEMLGAQQAEALVSIMGDAAGRPLAATAETARGLDGLSLSGRARALAAGLLADVGGDHAVIAAAVRRALDRPDFDGWLLWPVGLAVALRGVDEGSAESFDGAMEVLRELTPRMTSEFAIRPLLRHDLDRGLEHLLSWTADQDWNVRRLASEGSRPLLPWAERIPRLVTDPSPTLPILDALFDDPEESVRRSVANHLNDHSRAHSAFAVAAARGWLVRGGDGAERTARHAMRTLVKRGDPGALELLGFPPAELSVAPLRVTPEAVALGGAAAFAAVVENRGASEARLVIDYVLFFPGARGDERRKVFKLAQRTLAPGERALVEGRHVFREISTRRYYPGRHGLALQINGVLHDRADFAFGGEEAAPPSARDRSRPRRGTDPSQR